MINNNKALLANGILPKAPENFDVILPPAWAFGILYGNWNGQQHATELVHRLVDDGFPIDGFWTDAHFWDATGKGPKGFIDFVGCRKAYPDPAAFWGELESLGIRAGLWVWDRILKDGNEAVFEEFETRGFFSKVERMDVQWHTDGKSLAGHIDFYNPRAAAFWKAKLAPIFDQGVDFLKIDSQALLPYMKAAFEATQEFGRHTEGRGFIMAHCNGEGDNATLRYPTLWSGDSKVAWNQEDYPDNRKWIQGGLREQIAMVANPAHPNYRWPFLTNDTGGYDQGAPSDELFMRWTQFSCFNPVTEFFGHNHINDSNNPFTFSPDAQENVKQYGFWKYRLFPYIYSYALRSRLEGEKMIRGNGSHISQYFFGEEMIVAPVCEEGARHRHVYLPEGSWIDYYTDERHDIEVGTTVKVPAPLDRLPVFVRAGAIIPSRESARTILEGHSDPLTVDIYPDGESVFPLLEDDGLSNGYLRGEICLTLIRCREWDGRLRIEVRPVKGRHRRMLEERKMRFRIHRCPGATDVRAGDESLCEISKEQLGAASPGYRNSEGGIVEIVLPVAARRGVEVDIWSCGI